VKGIDDGGRARAQGDVDAAVRRNRCHVIAQVEPELRVSFAEADGGGARLQPGEAEGAEHRFVEARGTAEVAHGDGDVVDHGFDISLTVRVPKARLRSD
jgi:hypothetical protein